MSTKRRERMLSRQRKAQISTPPYKVYVLMLVSLFCVVVLINMNADFKNRDTNKIKRTFHKVQRVIEVKGPLTLADTVKTTQVIGKTFTVDCKIKVGGKHGTLHSRKEFSQLVELIKRQTDTLSANIEYGDITFNPHKTEAFVNVSFSIKLSAQGEFHKEIRDYQVTMIKTDGVWLISGADHIDIITRPENL